MKTAAFLGLRTVIYPARELDRARSWYSEALGVKPYFDEPFYVGFNVGGFELGLDPNAPSAPSSGAAAVAYWGVEDARKSFDRLVLLGAEGVSEVREVGGGILVATVRDPFGNELGIIENPHFPNKA
jgi:predicted enzyme related to lactoylglutathione lyase